MAEELGCVLSLKYAPFLLPRSSKQPSITAPLAKPAKPAAPAKPPAPTKPAAPAKSPAPAKPPAPKATRPAYTHFFALRVAPDFLGAAAEAVQAKVVAACPELRSCLIKRQKLHLTLGLLALPLTEAGADGAAAELDAAVAALRAAAAAAGADRVEVRFPGLGAFNKNVLFARCDDASGGALAAVAAAAGAALTAAGHAGQPDFAPHVTLAKTSKWRPRRGPKPKRPKIDRAIWAPLDAPLAAEVYSFEALDLLRMLGDDGDGGYPVLASARLS